MAKKSKSKQPVKKEKRAKTQQREERRFVSQTSTKPVLVYALGWLAAALLGGGAWGYFYAQSLQTNDQLKAVPAYLIAGGFVLLGVTIWLGTSSEPTIRVGDPGVAMEKGELRRMPWWAVSKITFDDAALAVQVAGKDETGSDWTFRIPLKAHAEAIGWLLKEALDRVPRRVDIREEILDKLPAAPDHAGQRIILEPLQVVGKKCAATGKVISYEPDARVCARCERAYLKRSVPKKCKCGNSLVHLRPKDAEDEGEEDEVQDGDEVARDHDSDSDSTVEKAEQTDLEKQEV